MKTKKSALRVAAVVVCLCGAVVWFGSWTDASDKTYEYEIRPEVPVGYTSDAVRMMDAYERLMDRYMSLVERNLNNLVVDLSSVVKKLNSIERKIDKLGTRIGRIEKALDIPPPKPQTKKTTEQKPRQ